MPQRPSETPSLSTTPTQASRKRVRILELDGEGDGDARAHTHVGILDLAAFISRFGMPYLANWIPSR
jgi:hypothetical protein